MEQLKEHQMSMTIEEQIENLKNKGLIINNEAFHSDFLDEIELLFDKYPKVNKKTMGFPDNWKELLGE